MWIKPWTIKEGFLIGGGLFFAGLMLELCVGPVDWSAFRWPVNGFLFGGFLTLIVLFYLLRKKVYGFLFISTYKAAIPALVYAIALTIVMGLTRQTADGICAHLRLFGGYSGIGRTSAAEKLGDALSPWTLSRHDYRNAGQCRRTATENVNGKG